MTATDAPARPTGVTVNEANLDKIARLIDEVEGVSTARTLAVGDVMVAASNAEKRLDQAGLPKRLRVGVTAYYNPWSVPNSYGHVARGTVLKLQRTSGRWVLTDVLRDYVPNVAFGITRREQLKVNLPTSIEPQDLLAALLRGARLQHDTSDAVPQERQK